MYKLPIFDIARCTRQTYITGTLFLKEYFKHAFEFWGTVCQMANNQNTVAYEIIINRLFSSGNANLGHTMPLENENFKKKTCKQGQTD